MPNDKTLTELQGWRAGVLWFADPHQPHPCHEPDGLVVTWTWGPTPTPQQPGPGCPCKTCRAV